MTIRELVRAQQTTNPTDSGLEDTMNHLKAEIISRVPFSPDGLISVSHGKVRLADLINCLHDPVLINQLRRRTELDFMGQTSKPISTYTVALNTYMTKMDAPARLTMVPSASTIDAPVLISI